MTADMGGGVAAVVLAATPAPRVSFAACWASLAERPVVAWSLDVVSASPALDEVILVVPASRLAFARELARAARWPATQVVAVPRHADGTWVNQLRAALETLAPACSRVVVHDGARPLLSPELLDAVLRAGTADEETVAVAGVPVKETLKLVDAEGAVRQTPARTDLRQLQSPIILPRAALAAALAAGDTITPDDGLDALLAVCAGCRTRVVRGSYDNLLIRTRQDLALAEELLRARAASLK